MLADSLVRLVLGSNEQQSERPFEGDPSQLAGRYAGPSRGAVTDLHIENDGNTLLVRTTNNEEVDTLKYISGLMWQQENEAYQYTFIRIGDRVVELRLDVMSGHYVLRRINE